MARLKSEIWVKAYIRSCNVKGVPAVVVNRGDADAGAIYIKVDILNGSCWLFTPAPAGFATGDHERLWVSFSGEEPTTYEEANTYIERQMKFDPDVWLIELEDQQGHHFLDDYLMEIK